MIRWVVALLIVANLALFLWTWQQPAPAPAPLPPPEIGHLELLRGGSPAPAAVANDSDSDQAPGSDRPGRPADATASPLAEASQLDPETAAQPPVVAARARAGAGDLPPAAVAVPSKASGDESAAGSASAAVEPVESPGAEADAALPAVGPARSRAVEAEAGSSAVEPSLSPAVAAIAEQLATTRPTAPACARIGPLDAAQLAALREALPPGVESVSVSTGDATVADDYFVLIPPLPTRADAEATLRRLTEAGVSDTWLFGRGELRNGISLGLFDREPAARRRADDMAARGFDVELRTRTRNVQRQWLSVQTVDNGLDRLDRLELPGGAVVSREPCAGP